MRSRADRAVHTVTKRTTQRRTSRGREKLAGPPAPAVTDLAEQMYEKMLGPTAARITAFAPGAAQLRPCPAPKTFVDFLAWLDEGWAIPTWDHDHPVMRFLIALDERTPLRLRPSDLVERNRKAVYLAFSLLCGELETEAIREQLEKTAGAALERHLQDPGLEVQWSDDGRELVLKSEAGAQAFAVPEPRLATEYPQTPADIPLDTAARDRLATRYCGQIELTDNGLGRIREVFVLHNRYLPYKALLALCRALKARLVIVTVPQSKLLHHVNRLIEILRQGDWDRSQVDAILESREGPDTDLSATMERMCREDGTRLLAAAGDAYISTWETLEHKLVAQAQAPHIEELTQRLRTDGIDLGRVTLVPAPRVPTRWARDHFLVCRSSDGEPTLAGSSLQALERNKDIGRDLCEVPELRGDWRWVDVRLPFEGGDMRALGPALFVGKNTFGQSVEKIREQLARRGKQRVGSKILRTKKRDEIGTHLRRELEALFGRSVVVVGEGQEDSQPLMHLDMFVTVLPGPDEKPTIVLADTDETVAILCDLDSEEAARVERAMVRASVRHEELGNGSDFWLYRGVFLKHDLVQAVLLAGLQRYAAVYAASPQRALLQRRLDALAGWFEGHGYVVARAPSAAQPLGCTSIWANHGDVAYLRAVKDEAKRAYNNALVEAYIDTDGSLRRSVYLPSYGLAPVERRLIEVYNGLGYAVVFVPYLWEPAIGSGGLDCLTSEVRGPFDHATG